MRPVCTAGAQRRARHAELASGPRLTLMAPPDFNTVHAALAYWAQQRPQQIALDDGTQRLDYATLAQQVSQRAAALQAAQAPAICWVDEGGGAAAQLLSFLAIVSANRTAAVSDPDWPPAMRQQIDARIASDRVSEAPAASAESAFYIGFTSGSSGLPKGFRRSHGSWVRSFEICRDTFGEIACTTMLAPGRLSHSTFLFGALLGL